MFRRRGSAVHQFVVLGHGAGPFETGEECTGEPVWKLQFLEDGGAGEQSLVLIRQCRNVPASIKASRAQFVPFILCELITKFSDCGSRWLSSSA